MLTVNLTPISFSKKIDQKRSTQPKPCLTWPNILLKMNSMISHFISKQYTEFSKLTHQTPATIPIAFFVLLCDL